MIKDSKVKYDETTNITKKHINVQTFLCECIMSNAMIRANHQGVFKFIGYVDELSNNVLRVDQTYINII